MINPIKCHKKYTLWHIASCTKIYSVLNEYVVFINAIYSFFYASEQKICCFIKYTLLDTLTLVRQLCFSLLYGYYNIEWLHPGYILAFFVLKIRKIF